MIPLLGRAAVRALDRDAAERLGLPTLVLMENAGRGAYEVIARRFPGALQRVAIIAGPGQNGGDGFVIARHLLQAGLAPRVLLIGSAASLRGDAAINHAVLLRLGASCSELRDAAQAAPILDAMCADASLIVDALFGTGLDRALVEPHATVVQRMAASGVPVVALDLPSGIDADTGAVLGSAVAAALTVTFAAHKRGLHQHPGASHAGVLECVPIGVPIPASVIDAAAGLIEASDVRAWLPLRAPDAHKGSSGHVLLVAGGPGRTGAAVLAGLGALRGGAGLVTLATHEAARAALDGKVLELMTEALPEAHDDACSTLERLAKDKKAAVIGPGFGLTQGARRLLRTLAVELQVPSVLDADVLTALGADCDELRAARAARVLTPHPGEAARLLGSSVSEVQRDRFAAAEALVRRTGTTVVLKGSRSIVAAPGRAPRVCTTGTPAMAVAGTGDVLAGVLGALLAQLAPFEAACAAVHLHGLAGELASTGDRGLLASELASRLPDALVSCRA
jgi:NAD(P)H-hydrate epimerase